MCAGEACPRRQPTSGAGRNRGPRGVSRSIASHYGRFRPPFVVSERRGGRETRPRRPEPGPREGARASSRCGDRAQGPGDRDRGGLRGRPGTEAGVVAAAGARGRRGGRVVRAGHAGVELDPEVVLVLAPLLYAAALRTSLVDFAADRDALRSWRSGRSCSRRWPSGWWPGGWSRACRSPPRSPWARSSRRRTRSPRRPSPGGSACPGGSSRSSRARACSTTRPPWWRCARRSPPSPRPSPCSRSPATSSSPPAAVSWSGSPSPRCSPRPASGSRTRCSTRRCRWSRRSSPTSPPRRSHASGVLAVVIVGLLLGHKSPALQSASSRLAEQTNWRTIRSSWRTRSSCSSGCRCPGRARTRPDGDFGTFRLVLICARGAARDDAGPDRLGVRRDGALQVRAADDARARVALEPRARWCPGPACAAS